MGEGNTNLTIAKSTTKLALILAIAVFLPGMQGRLASFETRVLSSHNHERQAMGMPPLKWDRALAESAQAWADYLATSGKFEHSPNLPGKPLEGENIWGGTSGAYSPEAMVNLWIEEKDYFVEGVFPANSSTGRVQDVSHYTQLVWRKTGAVGCGISQGKNEEILVCRYSQPGNLIGTHPLLS